MKIYISGKITGDRRYKAKFREVEKKLAAATLTKYYSGDHNQSAGAPLHTVTTRDREAITMASMVKLKGTNLGGPATEPVQTITAGGGHHGVITTEVVKATPGADLRNWPKIRAALNEYCGYTLADNEVILFLIGGPGISWLI